MDARQQDYLKALGITAWVRRDLELQQDQVMDIDAEPTAVSAGKAQAPPVVDTQPTSERLPEGAIVPPEAVESAPVVERVALPVTTRAAGDWDGLLQQVDACQQCELYKTRLNAVFGVGHRQPEWMIIGDAPGADEDKRKEPFVGEAGLLLNAMLQAVGMKRTSTFITNSIKCRPPNNRVPKPQELSACSGYLQRQIELLQPKLIIALGVISAQGLLHSEQELSELRGQIHHYGEQQIPLIVTHHPAHLLRVPAVKRDSWEDLQLAMSASSSAATN
ncbi:MAG: uracil-DNA glycosylase [Gammaproteobacteria bacterium]|nr:uracil-DNA glycosylase [Gammaproteobacteria bacterium]